MRARERGNEGMDGECASGSESVGERWGRVASLLVYILVLDTFVV